MHPYSWTVKDKDLQFHVLGLLGAFHHVRNASKLFGECNWIKATRTFLRSSWVYSIPNGIHGTGMFYLHEWLILKKMWTEYTCRMICLGCGMLWGSSCWTFLLDISLSFPRGTSPFTGVSQNCMPQVHFIQIMKTYLREFAQILKFQNMLFHSDHVFQGWFQLWPFWSPIVGSHLTFERVTKDHLKKVTSCQVTFGSEVLEVRRVSSKRGW